MDYSGKIIRKTPVVPSQTSASGVWSLDEALQAQRTDTWPVANVPDPISRSLRFRASASAYLNRTFPTAGNRRTWTWSGWIKRGILGTEQTLFTCWNAPDVYTAIRFLASSNTLYINQDNGAGNVWILQSSAVYRDPSAWYHVFVSVDTTQATSSNRVRVWVNGVQVTSFSTESYPSQNSDTQINRAQSHTISQLSTGSYIDGYLTEVQFIDGQALTPSSFGGTNAVTGVWEPRAYTGTYGTNGFYLPFSNITNTTTLGNDFSGNGNNWTTNNISLTAGSTYDSMLDVPTQWVGYNTGDVVSVTRGNYAVMNPITKFVGGSVTNANLTVATSAPGNDLGVDSSIIFPTSGKFYWEVTMSYSNDGSSDRRTPLFISDAPPNTTALGNYIYSTGQTAAVNSNVGTVNSGLGSATTNGQTICFAYDIDNARVWMSKQANIDTGTTATVTNFPNTSGLMRFQIREFSGTVSGTAQVNFGQRPFSYTPPAGFRSLCTTNLPSPTILQGNRFMDVGLYTGDSTSNRALTGLNFQPDFMWNKARSNAYGNKLYDAVRGVNAQLVSNSADAESTTGTASLVSFNSNGVTIGNDTGINGSGSTFVNWYWNAGGTTVTNTTGSISAQVRANPTAGFSVVTYTGTGANATVGHGLGVAPQMIIIKNRPGVYNWRVWHRALSSTELLFLNTTDATQTGQTTAWNSTLPTSTVFSLGSSAGVNESAATFVAYCWTAVAGYSAFGTYVGNGSADGPFVFTGFRPAFVMIKSTVGHNWTIVDDQRDPFNVAKNRLFPSNSNAEATTTNNIDMLSNGFKLRIDGATDAGANQNGATFIYAAFAENPFKNSLAR